MTTINELQAKIDALQKRMGVRKRAHGAQAVEQLADVMHDQLTMLFHMKSLDSITQDAAALDDLRKSLHVSDAMHQQLTALISDPEQLRAVYESAAQAENIPLPMFSDNLDLPSLEAQRAGLPPAVAEAISSSKRLNSADILSKVGNSFFFGLPLKPGK